MTQAFTQLAERLDQQYFGKYRGTVADNKDPLKLGRLKLRIPSLLIETPDTLESTETVTDWATPCVPFGGMPDQGSFCVPEVDANVWVEFEEGNIDRPIWAGTFWTNPKGAAQTPKEAQDMDGTEKNLEPKRRVFKSAAGSLIEFSDVAGKESVTIRHKDNATIKLDEKGSLVVTNKEGSFLYLNAADGETTLVHQNGANITLKGSSVTITNQAGTMIDVSGSTVQIVADSVQLRTQTVGIGEGAVEPAVLGLALAKVFDTHVHNCTAPGSPSGPPMPPNQISLPVNKVLSQSVKVKS